MSIGIGLAILLAIDTLINFRIMKMLDTFFNYSLIKVEDHDGKR